MIGYTITLGGMTMISRTLAAAIAATLLLAGAPGAGAEPLYTLSFLPAGFQGAQLNDAGQIVGTAGGGAAMYSGGVVVNVAAPPSVGQGINNHGDVTGSLNPAASSQAFTYVGGTLTNIHPFVAGDYPESEGVAINDQGVVGGNVRFMAGESNNGFIYRNGTVEYIGTFGGDYSPLAALNNQGVAAGYAAFAGPAGGTFHAYTYANGTLQDLGTLGGANSAATDINDLGQVAGWSAITGSGLHAFLYSGGGMINLGTLGGSEAAANALNDDGFVVGYSFLAGGGPGTHAFLYADGELLDLNTLVDIEGGWQLTTAQDINDAGQILGTACRNGSCTSVLLSPVPEPATGLMLLAGLGALLPLTRRPRRCQAHT
jgi:probable HAF family extracellular repeat protein